MFRFTIRDLLWLMVVAALAVTQWVNQRRSMQTIDTMREQNENIKKESKVWEYRAETLRNDMLNGTNKNTYIEFMRDGIE